MSLKIPYKKQPDLYSCGAACIKMLADYYECKNPETSRLWSYKDVKSMCNTTTNGTEFSGIRDAIALLDLKRRKARVMDLFKPKEPMIILIPDPEEPSEDHYVLVVGRTRNYFIIHDPYYGENKKIHIPKLFNGLIKTKGWAWIVTK